MPLVLLAALLLAPPTQIYFVRHGETQANATGKYNSRTVDAFSELGQKQVAGLTKTLMPMRFDAIVVSPSPRALRTIYPYLHATHQKAVIWPELYECCDAHSKTRPSLMSKGIRFGAPITLPKDIADAFVLTRGKDHFLQTNSYDDGLKQIAFAAKNLTAEFPGKRVLVVGHSLHGGRMIELLQGKPMLGKVRPANCSITHLTQAGTRFSISQ